MSYERRAPKMGFTQAAREVLGAYRAQELMSEWDLSGVRWFGDFLHERHHGVFIKLVAYMQTKGEW